MATLVAPRRNFGPQEDAPDPLGEIDFTFLDMRALLHELVGCISLENEVEN